jgi:hypothetical protein
LNIRLNVWVDAAGIEMPNRQVDVWMRGAVTAA